ncbi:hypothetical protein CYMTET_8869 [Cymbomonas tetramitiformis]|uniref:Uncharacterized protein n=1 Tax=Cymbomonas tetramitiformis TaxID=36881 RepID=A0AAE0LFK3_9CHLO|nr:hypothetical protein CYMTET_8869 [Cymbomonas tetramitiformis]
MGREIEGSDSSRGSNFDAVTKDVLPKYKVKASAISLRRNPSRWDACRTHMLEVLPPNLCFEMFEAVDGKLYQGLLPNIDALEAKAGCKLYRNWVVQDDSDVLRIAPEFEVEPCTAWIKYEKWFAGWFVRRPVHMEQFIEFISCTRIQFAEIPFTRINSFV